MNSDEWRKRLKDTGQQKQLAKWADVDPRTVRSWILEGRDPPFPAVAAIAEKAGKSLDWIAFGGERAPIDEAVLIEAILLVEEERKHHGVQPDINQYARMIARAYLVMKVDPSRRAPPSVDRVLLRKFFDEIM